MAELNEQLKSVAKEYARQFGQVIGADVDHWVGGDDAGITMCCFGDCLFFTLADMQVVIDRLPDHLARYGSREAVGQKVREWVEWWWEDIPEFVYYEAERIYYDLQPIISLRQWLDGTPREDVNPWSASVAARRRRIFQMHVVNELTAEYGEFTDLRTVAQYIENEMSSYEKTEENE